MMAIIVMDQSHHILSHKHILKSDSFPILESYVSFVLEYHEAWMLKNLEHKWYSFLWILVLRKSDVVVYQKISQLYLQ